ncbi:MAG: AI-2E family transporter [bacterium]
MRDLFWIFLGLVSLWFGYRLSAVFMPVLVGLLLAYLFNPLITFLKRKGHVPRPVTAAMLLAMVALLGLGAIIWLGPLIVSQATALAQKAPEYFQRLVSEYGIPLGALRERSNELVQRLQRDPMPIFRFAQSVIGTTTNVIFLIVLIPVYFFFFAWHFPSILSGIEGYLPHSHKKRMKEILGRMDEAFGSFFRGRLIISLMVGILFALGWLLTDVPYWFILGLTTGLLSIAPYLSTAGWLMALLFKYLDVTIGRGARGFGWFPVFIWPSLAFGVINFVEEWIMTPWIQGKSMDLSVVTITISLLVGGLAGGLFGLLLAIPVTACLKILGQELILPRLKQWAE